jgi:3-hydroxyacyl-CoA dehydrogenase/enoyl-CoA hydratase/3-hydroxybutyryl-CoA epimerase
MSDFQLESLSVEMRKGGIALLWLDVPDRPFNVLNPKVIGDLEQTFDRLGKDPAVKLLAILSRKSTGFLAGADLHEFTGVQGPAEATAMSARGQRLFDKLANLPMPVVAVIHGVCLGGGLELSLACDYRIAVDQPGTKLGLPEIKLGLLPGWGGTQRLPRVVGIERAIQVILQSRELNAPDALRWGLVDAVSPTQAEALALISRELGGRFIHQGKRPKKGPPLRTGRQWLLESNPLSRKLLFRGAERVVKQRVPDDMPAPLEALRAIRIGMSQGMDAGLKYEHEAIGRLATTTAARNLITLFFLMEKARKPSDAPAEAALPCRKVGVVGAGTMGAGIAQLAAVKGCQVVVQEINDAALAAGVKKIEDLFQKAVERKVMSADDARQKLAAIGKTTTWEGFGDTDLVIEAVIEDLDKKREVFRELERRTRPQTILATNTSSLSVTALQQGMNHPERIGGLHFFNPVHKMPLVEVIRAPETTESVGTVMARWAAALGKTPVVVKDSPGFVVNRVLAPYMNEAGLLVTEGMPVEDIDRVMRRFGMPMGPLELLDTVGLDVAAHVAKVVGPAFAGRLTPHPALELMGQKGWLGQKSGAGFYRYAGKKKRVNTEALSTLPGGDRPAKPAGEKERRDARERMVLLMVNEAAACLGEGLAPTADVIDLAMIFGTGWAPHRGGPLRYADDRGAADIVKAMVDLTRRFGPRFEPCAELRQRAQTGAKFYDFLAELLPAGKSV